MALLACSGGLWVERLGSGAKCRSQSLIGQWSGSWTGAALAKANGKYYLKIERVDGANVFGKGEVSGHKNTEFPVSGTLSGNQLTYGKTTLTVDGNHMTGKGQSMDISLTKE